MSVICNVSYFDRYPKDSFMFSSYKFHKDSTLFVKICTLPCMRGFFAWSTTYLNVTLVHVFRCVKYVTLHNHLETCRNIRHKAAGPFSNEFLNSASWFRILERNGISPIEDIRHNLSTHHAKSSINYWVKSTRSEFSSLDLKNTQKNISKNFVFKYIYLDQIQNRNTFSV